MVRQLIRLRAVDSNQANRMREKYPKRLIIIYSKCYQQPFDERVAKGVSLSNLIPTEGLHHEQGEATGDELNDGFNG